MQRYFTILNNLIAQTFSVSSLPKNVVVPRGIAEPIPVVDVCLESAFIFTSAVLGTSSFVLCLSPVVDVERVIAIR